MSAFRRAPAGLIALSALLLIHAPAFGQGRGNQQDQKAFFDNIHAPNWLRTDIAHTSIKSQRGGTCWNFATISFLESEVMRTNSELIEALRANRQQLDLSDYYVVYWAWVEKAREFVKRRGVNARVGDGGLSHDTTWLVSKYGIIPEKEYTQPENSGMMTREIRAKLNEFKDKGEWDEATIIKAVRDVLDNHLAPPPESFEWLGTTFTPRKFANDYLKLDYDNYWEITSYTDFPFYTRGELDIPDNWWDYDGYYNVPLDAYIRIMNRALDRGFSVAVDTDWGDMGASWNSAGIAVMHPQMLSPHLISQDTRQTDLEENRTTDDHLIHAVDHRFLDGHDWYLIKNSHGINSGRQGYVWMRGDYFAMRVLAIMVHKDGVDPTVVRKFNPPN